MPEEAAGEVFGAGTPRIAWDTLTEEGVGLRGNGKSYVTLRVLFAPCATEPWLAEFNELASHCFQNVQAVLYDRADTEGVRFYYIVDGDAEWCREQFDHLSEAAERQRAEKDMRNQQEQKQYKAEAQDAAEKAAALVKRLKCQK